MDTIKVTIEIYDNSTVQEVENAIEYNGSVVKTKI